MYLGLDLGTSGLRGLLVDAAGAVAGSAQAAYAVTQERPGWSEQEPKDWLSALAAVVADLKRMAPRAFADLRGIGVSGQMHGAVLLDADGVVLRPCILWNDTRSHLEAAELDGTEGFRDISGNIVFPGFTAPKLLWGARHEPAIFARIDKVLLPKDYINFWLTGRLVSDMSDAAGTSWLDTKNRKWSEPLLERSGMSREQMPDLVEGSEAIGTLRPDLAKAWGVSGDVTVVGGGADNAVAACGIGAINEGDGFVSLGTSGVILVARNAYCPAPSSAVHTFCHALAQRWYQMGVILAATDSLNWLAGNLGSNADALARNLGHRIGAPGATQFLPYLSGERTPHNDSHIRGAFLNLDIGCDRADLTRAVMEGVCFALKDCFAALCATGVDLKRAVIVGGGSASPYWVELMATVLNCPLDVPGRGEFGAALGAARLAIVGSSGEDPKTIMTPPEIKTTVEPRKEHVEAYAAAYRSWRAIYPAIRDLT